MRRRKAKIIMLSALVLSLTLSGCGKEEYRMETQEDIENTAGIENIGDIGNTENKENTGNKGNKANKENTENIENSGMGNDKAKIPLRLEHPDEENVAGMLQELLGGTAVQLNAGSLLGSGVIFSLDENEMVIVTAAHVAADAGEVSIRFSDGSYAESSDIWKSDAADVAFISLPAGKLPKEAIEDGIRQVSPQEDVEDGFQEELPAGNQEMCAVTVDKESFDSLKNGDGIVVMGSADGTGANAYEGNILETWIYMEDFEQYMILARTYAFPGMSGGGIFDLQGYFIGILCGGNEENDIAVLPLSIILSEYMKYR